MEFSTMNYLLYNPVSNNKKGENAIAEIKEKSGIELTDLHRQYMDKVEYTCPICKIRTIKIYPIWIYS